MAAIGNIAARGDPASDQAVGGGPVSSQVAFRLGTAVGQLPIKKPRRGRRAAPRYADALRSRGLRAFLDALAVSVVNVTVAAGGDQAILGVIGAGEGQRLSASPEEGPAALGNSAHSFSKAYRHFSRRL